MIKNKKMYRVAILLSTFNGDKYLKYQLESLRNQKKVNIKLFVIDDNSIDHTINEIKNSNIDHQIFDQKGFGDPHKNFFYLIKNVPQNYDYYCFCDQDDVWFKNKIIYSINKLKRENADIIGSRTIYTDENLKIYSKSIEFKRKLSLENSLVQSICGGNTQLWSNKFHNIVSKLEISTPASHDWMMYQIAMLSNSKFIYIKRPLVLYRQHSRNNIGANTGILSDIKRIYWGLKGRFKTFHDLNKSHLFNAFEKVECSEKLVNKVKKFYFARQEKNIFKKLYIIFFKIGIYRQTLKGNIMLIIACLLSKI